MINNQHSEKQAKKSLLHFLSGKAFSAVLGVGFLLLVVRVTSVSEYGQYVTLMAIVEVLYLLSGCGLSFYIQRFLPDIRLRLTEDGFRNALTGFLVRRAVYTLVSIIAVFYTCNIFAPFFDLELDRFDIEVFLLVIFIVCQLRLLDEIFPSLLLQGANQVTLLLRSGLRVVLVGCCFYENGAVSLSTLLRVELLANGVSLFIGLLLLRRYTKRSRGNFGAELSYCYSKKTFYDGIRYFAAQILGQCYSQNAVKLVVASSLGATGAAAYGFVQSVVSTVNNYQPAIFFLGWIRPLVVSRYIRNNDSGDSLAVVSTVFKVSLILLGPLICLFLVFGDVVGSLLSGGNHKGAGVLFVMLSVVVVLQGLHQLLGVLLITFQEIKTLFRATCVCSAASVLLWRLVPTMGAVGAAVWLILVEAIWVSYVVWTLVKDGRVRDRFSVSAYVRITASSLIALLCAIVVKQSALSLVFSALLIVAGTVTAIVFGMWSRPFSASELALIKGLLPTSMVRFIPGSTQTTA